MILTGLYLKRWLIDFNYSRPREVEFVNKKYFYPQISPINILKYQHHDEAERLLSTIPHETENFIHIKHWKLVFCFNQFLIFTLKSQSCWQVQAEKNLRKITMQSFLLENISVVTVRVFLFSDQRSEKEGR